MRYSSILKKAMCLMAVMCMMPIVSVAGEQVLKIIHPVIGDNWSPLRGGGHEVRWQSLQWASPMYFDENGKMQPYVFKKWSSNANSTVWTFTIDSKAVFSDGSKITAKDVKGTWDLCVRPSTRHERVGLFLVGVKGFDQVKKGKGKAMEGLVVLNSKTIQVTLTQPDPIFSQKLATALIPPVKISKAVNSKGRMISEWWHPDNDVVVSGPFRPVSMDLDSGKVVLERNPNFFGPKPKLDKIIITTVEDSQTATLMLQKGQMDAHTELNTPTMIKDLGADFASGNMLAKGHQFWIDSRKKPTDDINVRKALIMAIDTKKMFSVAFPQGPNQPATQVINKVAGVDSTYKNYSYDPKAAKAALKASRYGGAARLPKIMFVGISNPSHEVAAQYIAEQWRQVLGIKGVEMKANIDSYAGPDQASIQIFRDDVGTRVPDIVSYLMGSIHSSSGNAKRKMGKFKNAEIDRLLEEASSKATDDPQRIALAQKAQKIFRDQYQFIPYRYDTMSKWAMPWVKHFDKNDDWQVIAPWKVYIDTAQKAKMLKK